MIPTMDGQYSEILGQSAMSLYGEAGIRLITFEGFRLGKLPCYGSGHHACPDHIDCSPAYLSILVERNGGSPCQRDFPWTFLPVCQLAFRVLPYHRSWSPGSDGL